MLTPPPAYNFASLPHVKDREPLTADPELAVKLARGEYYLGEPRGNRRETLMVSSSRGSVEALVIFPGNSRLPIMLAAFTGLGFLGVLIKAYWLIPLSLIGVIGIAFLWAWPLGARTDSEEEHVGSGVRLPHAAEIERTPGWWGSAFLIATDAVFFGSLIFGYGFLWTSAPNWPPPHWGTPAPLALAAGLIGAGAAILGSRFAMRANLRSRSPWAGVSLGAGGLASSIVSIAVLLTHIADPVQHAYGATALFLLAYALLHVAVSLTVTSFLAMRIATGFTSFRRRSLFAISRLWSDYAAFVTVISVLATQLPSLLA
jgi:cytochrome c oxidase subunit I+III